MRPVAAIVGIALFAAGRASGEATDLQRLIEAERSFARETAELGIRDGFLAWLAEEAVLFRPGPVPGPEWLRSQPAPEGLLEWAPIYADLSAAGDLGYTTGPWRYASSFGHFVSLWQAQSDGELKVVLDIGTVHEDPGEKGWLPDFPTPRNKSADAAEQAPDVRAQDRRFSERWAAAGAHSTFAEFADAKIRYYRNGALPVVGRPAVLAQLTGQDDRWRGQAIGGATSGSGDLAYVYGRLEQVDDAGSVTAAASYLRIWTREQGGEWRVALDLASPLPPEAGG